MRRWAILLVISLASSIVLAQDSIPPGVGPNAIPGLTAELKAAQQRGEQRRASAIELELGEAYRISGDLTSAMEWLERALSRVEVKDDAALYARGASYLGKTYAAHGNLEKGLALIDESAAAYNRIGETRAAAAQAQLKAMLLTLRGNESRAMEVLKGASAGDEDDLDRSVAGTFEWVLSGRFDRAIAAIEKRFKERPGAIAPGYYWVLSRAYYGVGRYDDAEKVAAIGAARADRIGNSSAASWSRMARALALEKLGRLSEAANEMLDAIRVQEDVRRNLLVEDSWKRAFGDARQWLIHDVIDVVWRAGRVRDALEVVEAGRARAFLDLLSSPQTVEAPSVKPLNGAPLLASSAATESDTVETLIERTKRAGSPVISYWVHPDAVFIWILLPDGNIHAVRSEVSSSALSTLIERARSVASKPDLKAWRSLHELLIEPALRFLPGKNGALTLLLHGPLLNLPFAALVDSRGRYLVEDYSIRIAPVSLFIDAKPRIPLPGSHLLIGAPAGAADKSGKRLRPLPGAERELKTIAAAQTDSMLIAGKAAERTGVRDRMQGARILHFATHAVLDTDRPFQSFLALSEGSRLQASEIYDLDLNADLVILSACRSGSGKITADGLVGFTRAFLGAGASTVIAPLWDIPDEPTPALLVEFYRLYGRGVTKSAALRSAQLKVIRDLRAGRVVVNTPAGPVALPEHPILWAGFIVHGAD